MSRESRGLVSDFPSVNDGSVRRARRARTGRWLLAVGVAIGCAGGLRPLSAQAVPTPAQSIAAGSRVYGAKGCSQCHAINGIGGTVGPDLARLSAPSLASLVAALWNHLPQMAEHMADAGVQAPHFEPWEAADLMAFLFWAAAWTPPGDAKRGRELFTTRRCIVCHRVGDVGGVLGPALDGLRERASTIDLAADLWNHALDMTAEMRRRGISRPTLTGRDINDLVAYFGTSGERLPSVPVYALGGHAQAGRLVFERKGCVKCHRVGGRGGSVGPDLTAVAPREPADFAAAMWNKATHMLDAMKAAQIPVPRFTGAEMADLVAYLGSVQYLTGVGTASRGARATVSVGCTACHGRTAPALSQEPAISLRGAAIAALWNHVGLPAETFRRAWRPLTTAQAADVMAYLESRGRRP